VRDFTLWDALFTGPIAIALIGAIVFFLIYETLYFTVPLLANTVLFAARTVMPKAAYGRFERKFMDRWNRTPDVMNRSIWMRRDSND
jgi:hypothetical protein